MTLNTAGEDPEYGNGGEPLCILVDYARYSSNGSLASSSDKGTSGNSGGLHGLLGQSEASTKCGTGASGDRGGEWGRR